MMWFVITLILFGIIFVPFGALANKWKGAFVGLIIAMAISGALTLDAWVKHEDWNNGICVECGGEYKFKSAAKARNGSETRYYTCEDCDHLIRQ